MIAHKLKNDIDFNGKRLKLNLSFDKVLKIYSLFKEDLLSDADKLDWALEMLIENYNKIKYLGYEKKLELFEIISNYITPKSKKVKDDGVKTVDVIQDANYIYASFLMDYNIDLVDMQGKLDWRKFIALFQGLSDRTKIKEVMSIRSRKIPTRTKYNGEEIEALQEAKAFYALEISEEEGKENFQKGLNKLGGLLENMARKGANK